MSFSSINVTNWWHPPLCLYHKKNALNTDQHTKHITIKCGMLKQSCFLVILLKLHVWNTHLSVDDRKPPWNLTWWRHQAETFSALLALCAGNSLVTGEFLSQRPVTRSFDVFFAYAWRKGWVNNRDAGDLRRNRAHHGVMVITYEIITHCITL